MKCFLKAKLFYDLGLTVHTSVRPCWIAFIVNLDMLELYNLLQTWHDDFCNFAFLHVVILVALSLYVGSNILTFNLCHSVASLELIMQGCDLSKCLFYWYMIPMHFVCLTNCITKPSWTEGRPSPTLLYGHITSDRDIIFEGKLLLPCF